MIISADKLTEIISNNYEYIESILSELGFCNLKFYKNKNYYTFPRLYGDNPNGHIFYCDSLKYTTTTRNDRGNLFSLVMNIKNLSFADSLMWISSFLGLNKFKLAKTNTRLPFGGFYKEYIKNELEPETTLDTFGNDILHDYKNKFNTLWIKDGISLKTQEVFNICYDLESNSILIPEYTFDGKLCGIQARVNDENCRHDKRWWAFLPCSRNYTLYGYHINYKNIQEKSKCIITESEKGVMQLYDFNCRLGLGSCGCNISSVQSKYIKSLFTDESIISYDEGLDEEYLVEQAKKLVIHNPNIHNKVGYIYDRDNKYLPKGSKASPTDFGRDIFLKLYKECVVWLDE